MNDYEWIRVNPFKSVCYPTGPADHSRPHLIVEARRSKLVGPLGQPAILYVAYWQERIGIAMKVSWDGNELWGSLAAGIFAATQWHRHTVESYDGQHDVDLQRAGYGTPSFTAVK